MEGGESRFLTASAQSMSEPLRGEKGHRHNPKVFRMILGLLSREVSHVPCKVLYHAALQFAVRRITPLTRLDRLGGA